MFDAALWTISEARKPSMFLLYLLPDGLQRLAALLEKHLAAGVPVCTLGWEVPGWQQHLSCNGEGWYLYRYEDHQAKSVED